MRWVKEIKYCGHSLLPSCSVLKTAESNMILAGRNAKRTFHNEEVRAFTGSGWQRPISKNSNNVG